MEEGGLFNLAIASWLSMKKHTGLEVLKPKINNNLVIQPSTMGEAKMACILSTLRFYICD